MQLQVLKMSRTPLIIEENVKKMTFFWTILTKLTFSWIINEIYVNILIFVYGWMHNAPRIPKMYNIIGIWSTDQKLLTVKPIATLREMKWWWWWWWWWWSLNDSRGNERYMTKVIYQWNEKNDRRGNERYMTKVIYQWNDSRGNERYMTKVIYQKTFILS